MGMKFSKDVSEFIDFVARKATEEDAGFDKWHVVDAIQNFKITSPIEQLFVAALFIESHRAVKSDGKVMFSPQFRECGYVIDFMLAAGGKTGLVELDGFDFHDATKERATRDKRRDRALMHEGWIVIRFSGQEVSASPIACAKEAIDIVASRGRAEWL